MARAPGVQTKSVSSGPAQTASAPSSIGAFIGWTRKGPVGVPTDVLSPAEFGSLFGDYTPDSLTPTSVLAFFQSGGGQAKILRCVGVGALESAGHLTEQQVDTYATGSGAPTAVWTLATIGGNDSPQGAALSKLPILPGSIVVVGHKALDSTVMTLVDDGVGGFKVQGGSGVTGSIDYATGNILNLTFPATVHASTDIVVTYQYRTFDFQMKWPGVAGNDYRVAIAGDTQYEDHVHAKFSRFTVTVQETADGGLTWLDVEPFTGIDLDDPTGTNGIVTVLNDPEIGSKLVTVVANQHAAAPTQMAGSSIGPLPLVERAVVGGGSFDGSTKQFLLYDSADGEAGPNYSLHHLVNAGSLKLKLLLAVQAEVVAAADGILQSFTFTPLHKPYAGTGAKTGQSIVFRSTATTAKYGYLDLTASPPVFSGADISIPDCSYNPTTGEIVVKWGTVPDVSTNVTCSYQSALVLLDDGVGGLYVDPVASSDVNSLAAGQTNQIVTVGSGKSQVTVTLSVPPVASDYANTSKNEIVASYYRAPALANDLVTFAGGVDGDAITTDDMVGASAFANRTGLYALDKTDDALNVVVADFQTDDVVCKAALDYAELRQDLFILMAIPKGRQYQSAIAYKKYQMNRPTSWGAYYYPHVQIANPIGGRIITIPPGALVAGRFAAVDTNKNVSKAPAGIEDGRLTFARGLEIALTKDQVGLLNDAQINCLVDWKQTGRCIWGARLPSQDDFTYVNERRLQIFIAKSMFNSGFQFVFEDNGPGLWGRVSSQGNVFLGGLFQKGYFGGTTPADSYEITVDSSNNTPATVARGEMWVAVAIATKKPAEFITFLIRKMVS